VYCGEGNCNVAQASSLYLFALIASIAVVSDLTQVPAYFSFSLFHRDE
jgi:hypothetical protein